MTSELKWQEPPTDARKKDLPRWIAVAAALKDHPNRWAIVTEADNTGAAYRIKTGSLPAFRPSGSFEAVARSRPDGKFDIYARFVGGDS